MTGQTSKEHMENINKVLDKLPKINNNNKIIVSEEIKEQLAEFIEETLNHCSENNADENILRSVSLSFNLIIDKGEFNVELKISKIK